MSQDAGFTINLLNEAFQKIVSQAPEPNIVIVPPHLHSEMKALERWDELTHNELLWQAFLAGYGARRRGTVHKAEARMRFSDWCWQKAREKPSP